MPRVIAFGVFDGLHPGHLAFLRQARALGTELVVVVTSDAQARSEGKHPALSAEERAALVTALRDVDMVVIGDEPKAYGERLAALRPDVVAVGYDQQYDSDQFAMLLAKCGIPEARVVRCEAFHPERMHTHLLQTARSYVE